MTNIDYLLLGFIGGNLYCIMMLVIPLSRAKQRRIEGLEAMLKQYYISR